MMLFWCTEARSPDRPRSAALGLVVALASLALACGGSPEGEGVVDAGDEVDSSGGGGCVPRTCAELGWACGKFVTCGMIADCADEGRECEQGEACIGGVNNEPTECVTGSSEPCGVCPAIPDCSGAPQLTRLQGRVVTPGRDDDDDANQVGVPNALVYILRNNEADDLPDIPTGIPAGGTSCGRCEDELPYLGPVLSGVVSDETGRWEIEGDVPVGEPFLLVVKVGKYRRAEVITLDAADACADIELPLTISAGNPTRLPRHMDDGTRAHIPKIAVSTGRIDAMECVLWKMGTAYTAPASSSQQCTGTGQICEFGNHPSERRIHLYRGRSSASNNNRGGMRVNSSTPNDDALYGSLSRLEEYDMVVADCEGAGSDAENHRNFQDRNAYGDNVRSYLNRGGRMFASHLSFTWLHGNGEVLYADATDPADTGLAPAATWRPSTADNLNDGIGLLALGAGPPPPRLLRFGGWLIAEGVLDAIDDGFDIRHPRSQVIERQIGTHAEEYVFCQGEQCTGSNVKTHQFAFNTPYGAPTEEACGRVVYSGFHVAAAGSDTYQTTYMPSECGSSLTAQEKTLLYMLFDLGACLGDPLPPECMPRSCDGLCGYVPDGCGDIADCGPCPVD